MSVALDLDKGNRPPAEPILDPGLPIIDPHHHLWDRSHAPLPAAGSVKHEFEHVLRLSPRYLLDELLADVTSGHNVVATVYMECGSMYRPGEPTEMQPLGEVEFVNGVAAMSASGTYGEVRACAGIVGHANLMLGDRVSDVLEAMIAASPSRLRGIRYAVASDADPAVLGPLFGKPPGVFHDPVFRAGFARLAPLGLSFDAWLLEPQLDDLVELGHAFPDTSIILNHIGTPLGIAAYQGRRSDRFENWRTSICALAELPNMTVKLGGLAMPFGGFDYSGEGLLSARMAREWQPYFETCIDAFGVDRCMFESNFPVDRYGCDYATLWNAMKRVVTGASPDEKAALFANTAARIYRLEL